MATVTAADVKRLREITGAGPADCKKALDAVDGDFPAAEKLLKEKGLAAIEKRQDRATNEGRIFVKEKDGNTVALVELDSETDFVAKNPDFIALGGVLAEKALERGLEGPDDELNGLVTELATKIREKMTLKRVRLIKAGAGEYVSSYIHGDGQNLGVAVVVAADKPEVFEKEEAQGFVHNLALHVAAFNPKALDKNALDAAFIAEQEALFGKQMEADEKLKGKPANVIAGILKGKMNKYLADICFVDQAYVKDDKLTVAQALEQTGKQLGAKLVIKSYVYFKVGG
jgi:elongation factor Ts